MKKRINILATIVVVIITVVGFYFSDFSTTSLVWGTIIIIFWGIIEYLLKCNTDLGEKIAQLNTENNNLKDKINVLDGKIFRVSMVANQGTPYKILCLSKSDIHKGIKRNREYTIEAIISTLNKQYHIKYLNISFNERVVLNQENIVAQSMYKLSSNIVKSRNGRYEYSFELGDNYLDMDCAKCVFKIKYELDMPLNMNIEVSSDDGISKIESFNYQTISN